MTDQNAPEAAIVNSMYGDGFEYRWAITDKLALWAIGAKADVQVKKMIDQALGNDAPAVSGEMKAAMALLPQAEQANTVMTLNVLRFWGMVKAMAPVPLPDIPVNTKSSIVIGTKSDKGKFSVDVVVPKTHAIEIRDVVMSVMMQSQSAQQ
jgi:hypothetical protein